MSKPLCTAPVDLLRAEDTADTAVAMPLDAALTAVLVALDTVPVAVLMALEVSFTAVDTPLLTAQAQRLLSWCSAVQRQGCDCAGASKSSGSTECQAQGRTVAANAAQQVSLHDWLVGQQQECCEDRAGRCSAALGLPHSCSLSLVACADLWGSLKLLRRPVWRADTPETRFRASGWQQLLPGRRKCTQLPASVSCRPVIAGFLPTESTGPGTQGPICQLASSCCA